MAPVSKPGFLIDARWGRSKLYTLLIANEHQILGKMELKTERLRIRPPRIDDWESYNSIVTDTDCGRYLPDKTPPDPEEDRREDFEFDCQH